MFDELVADASPLIAFARLNRLDILSRNIIIPSAVAEECLAAPANRPGANEIKSSIKNKTIIVDDTDLTSINASLFDILGKGETEAILLADKLKSTLLIDDKAGRNLALKKGIQIIGTVGILIKAKQKGIIDKIKPLIEKLTYDIGYRLSNELIFDALQRTGEI